MKLSDVGNNKEYNKVKNSIKEIFNTDNCLIRLFGKYIPYAILSLNISLDFWKVRSLKLTYIYTNKGYKVISYLILNITP